MASKDTSKVTTKRPNGTTVTLEPVVDKDGRVVDTKRTVTRKDGSAVRVRTRGARA